MMNIHEGLHRIFVFGLFFILLLFFYVSQFFFINLLNMITDPVFYIIARVGLILLTFMILVVLPIMLLANKLPFSEVPNE